MFPFEFLDTNVLPQWRMPEQSLTAAVPPDLAIERIRLAIADAMLVHVDDPVILDALRSALYSAVNVPNALLSRR